jgi:hypothetical protein
MLALPTALGVMPRPGRECNPFPVGRRRRAVIAPGPGCQRIRAPRSDIERPEIRIAATPRADEHELLAIGRERRLILVCDIPVKVLDRKLPQARKGRIWPYVGDRDHLAAVYDYIATRERAGPEEFLKSYRVYLQTDAYPA